MTIKFGIDRQESFDHKCSCKKPRIDYTFNENCTGKYVVELAEGYDARFERLTKSIICQDIALGQLGSNPHIYTWINRPEKIENGKSTIKKNYRVL